MMRQTLMSAAAVVIGIMLCLRVPAADPDITISTPTSPPEWALLQRELLDANAAACREFYAKYFDERGYLRCVERWGTGHPLERRPWVLYFGAGLIGSFLFRSSIRLNAANSVASVRSSRSV